MAMKVLCLRDEREFIDVGVSFSSELEVAFLTSEEPADIMESLSNVDALVVRSHRPVLTNDLIEAASRLRLIQFTGSGYDTVDIDLCREKGIKVARAPGANARSVAEYSLMSMLMLSRKVLVLDSALKGGKYQEARNKAYREGNTELSDCEVGIVGMGPIGREVAKLCRTLDAAIYYHDIVPLAKDQERELAVEYLPLQSLLARVDVLTLHCAINESTVDLIAWPELRTLKSSAVIVNSSRGGIVNEKDLAKALVQGEIAGAAVDAFVEEPLPIGHPFFGLPADVQEHLILSPHMAGATLTARRRMLQKAVTNVARLAQGLEPLYIVNS